MQFILSTVKNRANALLLVAVGLAILSVLGWETFQKPDTASAPRPLTGGIDVSAWDFLRHGSVTLSGEWSYVDQRWSHEIDPASAAVSVHVPGPWPVKEPGRSIARQDGHGTYLLKLRLPTAPFGERFAISTGYWLSSYRVFANGVLITSSGVPAPDRAGEVANVYSKLALLPENAQDVELRVEVSNHINRYGGSFQPPVLGLESALAAHALFGQSFSAFLTGAMLFAALYHFVLFLLDRRSTANLWFGGFALFLALRTLTIDPLAAMIVPFLGQDAVWRIDFASSMLLLPTLFHFFHESFPRHVSKALVPWCWGFGLGAALLTLIGGPVVGEFGMKVTEVIGLGAIVYLTVALARAVRAGEKGALLSLAGWLFCASASVHDILMENGILHGINLIPYAFLAFFLCLSGMLAARYRDAFRQAQSMSARLKSLNEELELAVQERTSELNEKLLEISSNQAELQRAKEEAVSANIAKSRFLATMSHELRTPLNSILGFSEIIRDAKLGNLGDQRYGEYASYINESGAHLLSLIGDILDLSRIESGRLDLQFETVDVAEIAEDALARAATRERQARDLVRVSIAADLPALHADRRALLQMVINLVSNALKFTPEGGRVAFSAFERSDGGITLQVEDNGIGMTEAEIPKALMPFTQVDDNLSRRSEGSGLGLAIVKSLIEHHDGRIDVTSTKGVGTRVRLVFPRERSVAKARATSLAG